MRRGEHLRRPINRSTRSAALIATAVTVPVVVVLAFLVGGTTGTTGTDGATGGASPSTTATPGPLRTSVPDLDQATAAVCDPVMAAMPVTVSLADNSGSPPLQPVLVTPGGPSFLAWGNPLVTLQCGVARPSWLRADNYYGEPTIIATPDGYGATWVAMGTGDRVTLTVIDRAVYFEAVVPKGDVGVLTDLSGVIGKALAPVCTQPQQGDPPDAQYCGSRP